ncbi:hypothetical protein OROMI_000655 [Orobanche minor]
MCSSCQASSYGADPDVDDLTLLGSDDGSDIEQDGRIALRRNVQALHQRMSSAITQSFKRIANPTGFSWKLTLQPVKLQYFDEFRKRFSWPPSWEDDVYRMWESRAHIHYRDYIHDMKVLRTDGDLERPNYYSKEMWRVYVITVIALRHRGGRRQLERVGCQSLMDQVLELASIEGDQSR